ncbi:hypothetical protein GDI0279 [Gluconacetobacter diazotrophicus PA1 5]|uniref:Uncharacterized protein n=1 Tax=Gluconacetobacter diazotrophicus (strain ATCC 49037 / DSM 5601 / CCUG 37298 / CIP 103539 / LMG 7603 / PAl5) TaxID=272568 RepID=A9H303_GLUDA|nr:hypothetical protein GDI0279 [Gluconacetobacter diazotrophicus PA1 5]
MPIRERSSRLRTRYTDFPRLAMRGVPDSEAAGYGLLSGTDMR